MKNLGEMLLRTEPFSEIVLGNTATARAMIESGDAEVVTSYPSSPTPEIASALLSVPGRSAHSSSSPPTKRVATEVACGASSTRPPSCVFFRRGAQRGRRLLRPAIPPGTGGGLVAVLGDDPGSKLVPERAGQPALRGWPTSRYWSRPRRRRPTGTTSRPWPCPGGRGARDPPDDPPRMPRKRKGGLRGVEGRYRQY